MEILNILMQVAQSEHESEERIIIRYKDSDESEIKSKILNKSTFTGSDLTNWNTFVEMLSKYE
jgi:hypothetical protein